MSKGSAIKLAERAGIYLGAMAVVGRINKFGVTRIMRDDDHWPGTVVFKRPILPPHIVKFARSGDTRAYRQLEQAVMTNIAGAMALAFAGTPKDEAGVANDPQVQAMIKILETVDWWRSQAQSHLAFLQHRVVRTLAEGDNWRAVARVAQLSMAQPLVSAPQFQQQIKLAANNRTINGCEQFVAIDQDSGLPGQLRSPARDTLTSTLPPCPPVPLKDVPIHDGVISHHLMVDTFNAMNDRPYFNDALKRLKQTEPSLLSGIELQAIRTLGGLKLAEDHPQTSMIREGVVRCGVFVADAINRGHTAIWQKDFAE